AYRLWRLSFETLRSLRMGGHPRTIAPTAGTVLLSNPIVLASFLPAALRAAGRAAFICHDAIPIVHPDFAVDVAHARRFAGNIALMLRARATVICSSAAAAAMLAKAVPDVAVRGRRLSRVPLPSILFEKAARTGALSRVAAPEPFILYASTVEARKNHLLLARVWQQAADDGIALPRLVCTGKWGWGVGSLLDYIKAHPGLSSRIEFTGPVS